METLVHLFLLKWADKKDRVRLPLCMLYPPVWTVGTGQTGKAGGRNGSQGLAEVCRG